MQVTINGVSIVDKGKYKAADVSFNKDGKDETRSVVSFGDSAPAFTALAALKTFPLSANIKMVKAGKYWNWIGVEVGGNTETATAKSGGRVTGSNYETSEERARRQVYIVRQSSVSAAIEILKTEDLDVDDVIDLAKKIEAHVFKQIEPEIE